MCKHSCHVRVELEAAANEQAAMYDTGASIATSTTFTKQLYRLLALSLAGYHLVKLGVECQSSDGNLGDQYSLQACADACDRNDDCEAWSYRNDNKNHQYYKHLHLETLHIQGDMLQQG